MTNDMTPIGGNGKPTMSTREIANLTGSSHDNVLKTVRNLIEGGVVSGNETPYVHPQNRQTYYEIHLDQRDTMVVVSGYNVELRAKIVDRWMELEAKGRISSVDDLLANPVGLLRIAQGYAIQIEDLKRDVSSMKQDVSALDRISKADDLYGLRQTVQILQQQERSFVRWVQSIAWCFRQNGSKTLMAYADKRKAQLVTHKLEVFTKPDGSEGTREVLKFTTAGIVKLAKMLGVDPDFTVSAA
jgi:phage antirepressor YoqD-like protein